MPPPLNPSIRQFTQSPKISKPPITPPPQTKASSPKVQESPKSNTSNQFGLGNIAFKQSELTIDGIVKMLQGNEKCDVQRGRTSNWSELPDLAIVEIEAPEKESKTHSVAARRLPNGEHYLYDKRFPEPVKLVIKN